MYNEKNLFKKKRKVKKIFFVLAAIIVFTAVVGTVVMLLWNAIIPNILNTRPIKLWEAIGLLTLFRLLTGRFRGGGMGKKMRGKKGAWKEKWINMTEEERAEFKNRWKERCGRR
ncbi:MAG: ABC-type multidrug transport system fused ATPase/permease subunit [Polaribacter sp.]|jgi:ABC-type multidrug transport system fused ATPase/permease subunit